MNYILDIFVLVVVCFLAWRCSRKGFVKTAVLLFGFIIAAFIARTASLPISNWIYDGFVSEKVTVAVEDAIGAKTEELTANIDSFTEEAISSLPKGLQNISKFFINEETLENDKITESLKNSSKDIAETIEENIVRPAVIGLMQTILFIVLFFVLSFLIKRLAFIGGIFNKIPLVGNVNRFLGGVVGTLEGIIIVFLAATVLAFVIMLAGETSPVSQGDIEKTYLFRFFYENNPLIKIK
jgi:uncharacterized membrane protein required for colicin V production